MSTSNIVPYYSSSPPPLDEDDDTAHSLDDNDDEFGDFSSAPTASTAVGMTTLKSPANESVFFRPISKNLQPDLFNDDQFAEDYEIDESPPISDVKHEPVSCSPVFTNDQLVKGNQKGDSLPCGDDALPSLSAANEQGATIEDTDESKMSLKLNCAKQTNRLDAEKTSDSCNSADFGGEFVSHFEDPVKDKEFQHPVVHDVLAEQCSVADVASINSIDTTIPDTSKDPVCEKFNLGSVQDANKQNVVMSGEDEFDDFETFQDESSFKESQLESVISERTAGNAEISTNGDKENFALRKLDEEQNIKTTNDIEKIQADTVEFNDLEYFEDDSSDTAAASNDADIATKKEQDDVDADTPNSNSKMNAADDFEEFESAQELHEFELCQQSAAGDSHQESVVSKDDSSGTEISRKRDIDEIMAETPGDNTTEFLENQAAEQSTEEILFKTESGDNIEASKKEAVLSRETAEMTSPPADDMQDEKCDFDEFEEFQFADDEVVNPPLADAVHSIAGSVATTSKTDDTNSSWSAFSKEDETSEDSWAAFNADTNLSSNLVKNEKLTSASTVEELKTPAVDFKESFAKSAVDGSQAKFETLTSRVVTNCYPLVKETDIIQLQLLLDVISQTQELTDNSSKSLSLHTGNMDPTTRESKGSLADVVCVWDHLKLMDLTSAFSFQWPTSSISRNLLSAINVDLSSILVGHKKPQAPLFAPNLGLLEPMKAPTELQIAQQQADKDPLTFSLSDSSSSPSGAAVSSAFSPQDVPQLEFDWGGSGLTNPLDATEKERELLDALEPPANEASMKMPPMSLETMMATLLPSIPSTQRIPKSQKDVDRKHLSEEAIQVLSKLPDLSFMQAKVLMFPLKDIASN